MNFKSIGKPPFKTFLLALSLIATQMVVPLAQGQIPGVTFTTLAAFNDTITGANPYAPPVLGADGNLYGTLPYGGTNKVGVVFRVTTTGSETTFHNFNKSDGAYPYGPLVSARDGSLYGAAYQGGTNNQGTLFKITTNGAFTLLYSFGMATNGLGYAVDGANPIGGLVQGRDGNFYGATSAGGTNNFGTLFQFSTNGVLTTLHAFAGNGTNDDGASPFLLTPLVESADGVFYGTTSAGGTNNDGTIFQITADGTLTTLFEFNGTNGSAVWAGLSFGTDGNLYGTASDGGGNGYGTAFQFTTNGFLTTLFDFGGADDLHYPYGGVVPGNNNTLFGTAYGGGAGRGAVFQLTTNGLLTTLHSFTYTNDGGDPVAGVIRDAGGNLYGTAYYGGTHGGYGTAYRLSFTTLLSIISPTPNEHWSDGVFSVGGTASDNAPGGAVTNVLCSMNGGAWTNATSENGWINWTAGGALGPGTNTIAAYAVDSGGNNSATDTVRFVYVSALKVTTNGLGSLSPKYNGALLTVGNSYSITATTPTLENGFVFANWTGGTNLPLTVITNKPTIRFVMEPNLMLQANFVDVRKPVLAITAPVAGQRWSNEAFTVQGKARDNSRVTNVFYSLNGGPWTNAMTANSWTNWSAALTLVPGSNTIAAYAVDGAGNISATSHVGMDYVLSAPLNLVVIGKGAIGGAINGKLFEINKPVALTATPGLGYVLRNWQVTVDGVPVISTNKPVAFEMESNLVLTATFVDVEKPVLTITKPVAGQRWSNETFTVAGRVSDNGPVSNVWYSVNGSAWTNATMTAPGNNWSNWTAVAELTPGPANAIAAYAVDAAGNISATSHVSMDYVLSAPLNLVVIGKGLIGGGTNGKLFEIDKPVVLTATPGLGYVLTNWQVTVDGVPVISTNKAVAFEMQSNLVLTATFADVQKPLLTITAPVAGQRWTNGTFTVAGRVSDNGPVSNVWYSVNGSPWTNATMTAPGNNWSNWTAVASLTPGTNAVAAYAVDAAGNQSVVVTRRLIYIVPPAQLASTSRQVVSQPPPPPVIKIGGSGISDGQFGFNLTGQRGQVVVVESSTDLVNWQPMQTNTITDGPLHFSDPQCTNYPSRFYRVRSP